MHTFLGKCSHDRFDTPPQWMQFETLPLLLSWSIIWIRKLCTLCNVIIEDRYKGEKNHICVYVYIESSCNMVGRKFLSFVVNA